ncbi:hypothetical protein Tco_1306335 [Tanacetum coccineum]
MKTKQLRLVDENAIRLWLKEQQDTAERLAQQQAAAFQAQIKALRAELQVATGVLQTRHGGGGDQGSLLPRSMRLDVPKWTRGHKCPGKFLLLMTDNDEGSSEEVVAGDDEAVESGDISILNSLVGHGSPRSLQLWGKIGTTDVHVLIDNGSTQFCAVGCGRTHAATTRGNQGL